MYLPDEPCDGGDLVVCHMRLGGHVPECPMMPDHAEPHGPKEGEIGVMAGMVEPVDERRAQIRPGRVLAVASAAIRDKRQSALLRARREYGDDHPGGLALRLGLKETPPHGRQCADQEDSGESRF